MENASKALIIAGAILIALLLVGIGVLLISSGTDITSRGQTAMQSQKIQSFNAQFLPYEGLKKGSELKNLENVVRASNASNPNHQVSIYMKVGENDSTHSPWFSSVSELNNSSTYGVDIIYCKDVNYYPNGRLIIGPGNTKSSEIGYVCTIQIYVPGDHLAGPEFNR